MFGGFGGFGMGQQGGMTQAQSAPLGGFFLSPPNENSMQQGKSGLRSRRSETGSSRDLNGLIPVTVKQLLDEATSSEHDGGPIRICGHDASCLELVGSLQSVSTEETFVRFVISDGTGTISAKRFIESSAMPEANLRAGQYVRIFGPLRNFGNDVHISAYRVTPIDNPDEITRHMISVIHAVVMLSDNNAAPAQARPVPAQPFAQVNMPANGPMNGEFFLAEVSKTFGPRGPRHNKDNGFSRNDLYTHFAAHVHPGQVDRLVQELAEEGHLYTLRDDNHFQLFCP